MEDPRDREAAVLDAAPLFAERPKLLRRLVQDPCQGNAWHADHIVMVAEGGGECGMDNARTLCVLCHASVTAEQARGRRGHKRRLRGAHGGEGEGEGSPAKRSRSAPASVGVQGSSHEGGEENEGNGAHRVPLPPGKMWHDDAAGGRHIVDKPPAKAEAGK